MEDEVDMKDGRCGIQGRQRTWWARKIWGNAVWRMWWAWRMKNVVGIKNGGHGEQGG